MLCRSTIRDKIIPHAVSWFTGEAIQEDEFGDIEDDDEEDDVEEDDDDEEEDDEEEEDDDDDEEDEEESKPKKKVDILLMWPDFILFIILFLKLMLIIICHIVLGCCCSHQPDTRCVTSFPVSFISITDYLSPWTPFFHLSFLFPSEKNIPHPKWSYHSFL